MKFGELFAGYQVICSCGHGSFGEVFLAEDMLGNRVALKVFSGAKTGESELQALRRYMQLPPHPAICRIYHCGMERGVLFYTMEPADNALDPANGAYEPDTLARRMAKRGQLPIGEAIGYCEQLVDALETLHNAGLTHRDVKPENIIFVKGQLKIADFGLLADVSQTLSLAGTLGFLPPELLEGKHVKGPLCDIYAVGKILYCTVTGKEPMDYPALPDNLPTETLQRLCIPAARLCARNPEKRCGTCRECRELLEEAVQGKVGFCRGLMGRLRMAPALARRIALVALAVILLGCAGGYGLSAYLRHRKQLHTQAVMTAQKSLDDFRSATAKLPLQWPEYDLEADLQELERLRIAEDLPAFNAYLDNLLERLRHEAKERLPELPDSEKILERYQALAKFFGYLESPLAGFLPEEMLQSLQSRAHDYSAVLTPDKECPRQGEKFHPMGWTGPETWNYIPPQSFFSSAKGSTQTIDYPFWVMDRKLTNEFYLFLTRDVRNERLAANDAANNLNWNDILNVCLICNMRFQNHGVFPPGYGIRPPTEAEWELISQGGWSSRENPFQLHDTTRGAPYEVVLPYPETMEEERQKDMLVLRGCSPDGKESFSAHRIMLKDTWFANYTALRPVIAPMEKDFYQKQWFSNAVWREVMIDGKHYCGRGVCISRPEHADVQMLAGLLRARLPEPASPEKLSELANTLKLLNFMPFYLGISYHDGNWTYNSSGEKIDWPNLPVFLEPPAGKRVLSGKGSGDLIAMMANDKPMGHGVPGVVLEWATEEDYQHRLDCWKMLDKTPLLTSVTLAGKKYALLHLTCNGLETIGLAKLFGTTLAMLKDEDALRELQEKFRDTGEMIQLGGRRKLGFSVAWDDGTTTGLPGQIPPWKNHMSTSTNSLDGLAVYRGELIGSDAGTALLLEIP